MTATTMQTVDRADGWMSFATDPASITIKANSPGKWHVAISVTEPAADFDGEIWTNEFEPWTGSGITGQVWVRVNGDGMSFAVTI